jgi:hypothetical protein
MRLNTEFFIPSVISITNTAYIERRDKYTINIGKA